MDRLALRPAALALAFALLAACGGSPDPAADTPAPAPADTPGPAPAPAPEPTPAPEPAPAIAVPARFQGEWNRVPADCGTANNDSRLRIDADRITFHEASGPVVQATEEGDDLQVTVQLTGEGETVERRYAWRLSADGQSLTDVGEGTGMVRVRCH